MKKVNDNDFFKVLVRDNPSEMIDFLLMKGKKPKAVCPIEFVNDEEEIKNEE